LQIRPEQRARARLLSWCGRSRRGAPTAASGDLCVATDYAPTPGRGAAVRIAATGRRNIDQRGENDPRTRYAGPRDWNTAPSRHNARGPTGPRARAL